MPKLSVLTLLLTVLISSCSLLDFDGTPSLVTPEQRDSIRVVADTLRRQGQRLRESSSFREALELQTRALDMSLLLGDTLHIINDYNQLGTTFRRLARYEHAMNSHYKALEFAEAYSQDTLTELVKNYVISCNGLGNVHLSMGNDDMAEDYFRRALQGEIAIDSKLGMAINYANIGSIFEHRNMLDSALWYYERSYAMNIACGSTVGQSLCKSHYGRVYQKQGHIEEAELQFREAVALTSDHNDRWHAAEPLTALTRNLLMQKRIDEAQTFADEVMAIAQEVGSAENMRDAYLLQAQIYELLADPNAALESYRLSKFWSDSIKNQLNDKKMREACIDYETSNSQRQVERLQQAYDANQRMHTAIGWIALALLVILLVALGLLLYTLRVRKERLTALNRLDSMRTTFFRNLTHEFRTPLTVIMGLADQMKADDLDRTQRVHLLNSIGQQGKTLLDLVNELLGISKMMSGCELGEWRHGDIVSYLRMLLSGYTDFAKMRNVELRFESQREAIEMDFVPEYYQKIVNNLLGNAFKHTPSGGSITMRLAVDTGHLRWDFIDTGEGINIEDLPHVFELFYQGHNASKQGSTGIGLPYVQQMVRQMGGIISAENNLPRGTVMHITMATHCTNERVTDIRPWDIHDTIHDVRVNQNYHPQREDVAEDTSMPLVMVVEDNPDIADYIALLLHNHYRVLKANDAYDALNKVGGHNHLPDIILTDLMMPGMDGYELCHAIRQSAVLSDVPIVIISARSEDKDRVKGYEDGADGYLLKPFNPSELHALITRLLSQRKQQRQHMQHLIAQTVVPKATADTAPADPAPAAKATDEAPRSEEDEARLFLEHLNEVVEQQMVQGDLQLDTIANIMCMSRSTLQRRVKDIVGSSPAAYILQIRLDHARHLLSDTDLSISEISLSCGFDELSYFSRVFRQNFEMTPSQYRNRDA